MDFARGRLGRRLDDQAPKHKAPLVGGVANENRLAWPERKIETVIEIEEPIRCDRSKLGQLFSNLLGDAITYGDFRPDRSSCSKDQ